MNLLATIHAVPELPESGLDRRVVQIILIVLLLVGLILYFARLRSSLLDRVIAMTVFVLGMFFVIFPDATHSVANAVGVGRGADLLLYLTTFGLGFVALLLFSKTRQLEAQITKLARAVAINEAREAGDARPTPPPQP